MKLFEKSSFVEKIENYHSLLGCIKYKGEYKFYLMPIAWWILDYKKYDPKHSTKDDFSFRNNIYVITNDNKDDFMLSVEDDAISLKDLGEIRLYYNTVKNEFDNFSELLFFIDLDGDVYIYSFYDIELENYLPKGWSGKYDDAIKYLPTEYHTYFY